MTSKAADGHYKDAKSVTGQLFSGWVLEIMGRKYPLVEYHSANVTFSCWLGCIEIVNKAAIHPDTANDIQEHSE